MLRKLARTTGVVMFAILGLGAAAVVHENVVRQAVPVYPAGDGSVYVESWQLGFVSARGTWTIEGHDHAFPLNMSEVECVKEEGQCRSADANVSGSGGWLTTELERFPVTRWDDTVIEFGAEKGCVTYAYVINRSTKSFSGRRLRIEPVPENCPDTAIEADLKLSFVDGLLVVNNLERRHAPTVYTLTAAVAWLAVSGVWIVRVWRRSERRPSFFSI